MPFPRRWCSRLFPSRYAENIRRRWASEADATSAIESFCFWARKEHILKRRATEPLWRLWCEIARIDVRALTKMLNKACLEGEDAFASFRADLRQMFLAPGASEVDADAAEEEFCIWAVEKYKI